MLTERPTGIRHKGVRRPRHRRIQKLAHRGPVCQRPRAQARPADAVDRRGERQVAESRRREREVQVHGGRLRGEPDRRRRVGRVLRPVVWRRRKLLLLMVVVAVKAVGVVAAEDAAHVMPVGQHGDVAGAEAVVTRGERRESGGASHGGDHAGPVQRLLRRHGSEGGGGDVA